MAAKQWWEKGGSYPGGALPDYLYCLELEWLDEEGRQQIEEAPPGSAAQAQAIASWLERRYAFRLISDCMLSMVERLIGPGTPSEFWRLLIVCGAEGACEPSSEEPSELIVRIADDPARILDATDQERKEVVLSIVEKGVATAERSAGLDLSHVHKACDEVRRRGYVNEWVWGGATSPDGKTAEIVVAHDTEHLRISMRIYGRDGALLEDMLLVDDIPSGSDVWHRHLGDIRWDSPDRVVFVSGDEETETAVDIGAGQKVQCHTSRIFTTGSPGCR